MKESYDRISRYYYIGVVVAILITVIGTLLIVVTGI